MESSAIRAPIAYGIVCGSCHHGCNPPMIYGASCNSRGLRPERRLSHLLTLSFSWATRRHGRSGHATVDAPTNQSRRARWRVARAGADPRTAPAAGHPMNMVVFWCGRADAYTKIYPMNGREPSGGGRLGLGRLGGLGCLGIRIPRINLRRPQSARSWQTALSILEVGLQFSCRRSLT